MRHERCGIDKPKRMLEKADAKPSMLMHDISKLFGMSMRRQTEEVGISDGCRRIIMELSHHDGVPQLALAKHAHLSAPSVSVALSKLEADGVVERKTDDEDMRQSKVFITDKGREVDKLIRQKFDLTEEIMLRNVSEEETAALMKTLRKLLSNLIDEEEKNGETRKVH